MRPKLKIWCSGVVSLVFVRSVVVGTKSPRILTYMFEAWTVPIVGVLLGAALSVVGGTTFSGSKKKRQLLLFFEGPPVLLHPPPSGRGHFSHSVKVARARLRTFFITRPFCLFISPVRSPLAYCTSDSQHVQKQQHRRHLHHHHCRWGAGDCSAYSSLYAFLVF